MSDLVTIICDRCGKSVEGSRSTGMTAGYYNVTGNPWDKYANPGERVVCDNCMWKDERYQADYGVNTPHEDSNVV